MTVEHVFVALCILVAVVDGIDAALVLAVGMHLHILVGELFAGLVLIPSGDAYGFHGIRYTKLCGSQGVARDMFYDELAEEQVARSDGFFEQLTEGTGGLGVQTSTISHITIGRLIGGKVFGFGIGFENRSTRIARCPAVFGLSRLRSALTGWCHLVEDVHLISGAYLVRLYVLEAELLHRQWRFLNADVIETFPLSVLGGDGIDDGTLGEVLRRPVGGLDGGSRGDLEMHGDLCGQRDHEQRSH